MDARERAVCPLEIKNTETFRRNVFEVQTRCLEKWRCGRILRRDGRELRGWGTNYFLERVPNRKGSARQQLAGHGDFIPTPLSTLPFAKKSSPSVFTVSACVSVRSHPLLLPPRSKALNVIYNFRGVDGSGGGIVYACNY